MSAQNSRLKKKEESIFLNKAVKEKDLKLTALVDTLTDILSEEKLQQVYSCISESWKLDNHGDDHDHSDPATQLSSYASRKLLKEQIAERMIDNFTTKDSELERFK